MEINKEILNEIERFEQCGTHLDLESFVSNLKEILGRATPEGFVLVPKELSDEKADDQAMFAWNFNLDLFKSDNRDMTAIQIEEFRLKWCLNKARTLQQDYKAMIEAQEQSHD